MSGNFEPQVPSYDFLTRIKNSRERKAEQARGRFGPQTTNEMPDEGDDVDGDSKDQIQKYEDEMFGMEDGEGDVKKQMHTEKIHTEL